MLSGDLEVRITTLLKQMSNNFFRKEKIFFVEYIRFFADCLSQINIEGVDFLTSDLSLDSCYIECMKVPGRRCM